jgi:hypothetical protein
MFGHFQARLSAFFVAALILAMAAPGAEAEIGGPPPDVPASLAPAYEHLRVTEAVGVSARFRLQEHASDQTMVPSRGTDWSDGGIWRTLTQHEWGAAHPLVAQAWSQHYAGIRKANAPIDGLARAADRGSPRAPQLLAEARFLRALYYTRLLDLYGNVPVVVEREGQTLPTLDGTLPTRPAEAPTQLNRKQVFNFVLRELTGCTIEGFSVEDCVQAPEGVLATLPSPSAVPTGRASRPAAYALLARLLLNGEIYTGAVRGGFEPAYPTDRNPAVFYRGALAAAEQVLNSGRYELSESYYATFAADNHTSPEIIFSVPFEARQRYGREPIPGNRAIFPVSHYNQFNPSTPWNGFTTIANFYKSYAVNPGPDSTLGTRDDERPDTRARQYMAGRQYAEPTDGCYGINCHSDPDSGVLTVRGSDAPLDFTLTIPSLILDGPPEDLEEPGLRPLKYEVDPDRVAFNSGNDVPVFRYAEILLTYAEANALLGDYGSAAEALNQVRERAYADTASVPLIDPGRTTGEDLIRAIMQERGHEFHFEGLRRTDLIRYEFAHGGTRSGVPPSDEEPYAPTFTGPWRFKDESSAYRVVFPIPQQVIDRNPNLAQNPGY